MEAAAGAPHEEEGAGNRLSLIFARTLTSTAHALALEAVGDERVKTRLLRRGSPEPMFQQAVDMYCPGADK